MATRRSGVVVALLLIAVVTPSYSATFQLWDLLSSRFTSQVDESARGEHFRIVPLTNNLSVVYEKYDGIYIASFHDQDQEIPASFQLHVTSDYEGVVTFQCGKANSELSIVSTASDGTLVTELKYDNVTGAVYFAVKRPADSPERPQNHSIVDIKVYVSNGHLQSGSTVKLNAAGSKVVHASSEGAEESCNTQALVSVQQPQEQELCAKRSAPCDHVCDQQTGACACRAGYVVDTVHPEKCLATHKISMTIPGLQKSAKDFGILPSHLELLLTSRFGEIAHGGIHHVAVDGESVDVTTVEGEAATATEHAHRLRRALSDASAGHMTALGMNAPVGIRLSPAAGLSNNRDKRQVCSGLQTVLTDILNIDLATLNLPTNFDLAALCTDPADVVTSIGEVTVTIPVPDSLASTLLPDRLQLKNTRLTLVVTTSPIAVESLVASTVWVVGSTDVTVTVTFDVTTGKAVMAGQANGLSVSDIFTVFSPSLASSTGLNGVLADEVGFGVTFGRGTPTQFYFRLLIQSAADLVTNLIGASGLPDNGLSDALQAAKLDSFDITNVEFLVTNEGGRLCVKVSGNPVLPALTVASTVEIKAIDVGTPNRTVSYAFSVTSNITLAGAIKGFIPSLDLTGIPGLSLQLPEFSLSIHKPRIGLSPLPVLPDFNLHLPNVRPSLPALNLPQLKLPGVNFNSVFRPRLPNLPPLSIGGGIGTGPLCLNLKDNTDSSPASLTEIIQVFFPSLDPSNLGIPDTFQNLLNVEVQELCLNRSSKTFTAAVHWPSTIELIPSKPGYLSLTNTMVRVVIDASRKPVKFDFSAESSASLARFPLRVAFTRERTGEFLFSATPVQDQITTGDIAGSFGSAGAELRQALSDVQLSDVALSGLRIDVFNDPSRSKTLRFTATVSYKELPSVSFEIVVSNPFQAGSLLALGISTTSATVAQVVRSVIPSADISDVPFVADLSVPAVSVLVASRNVPTIRQLPFLAADLKELALHVSSARISLLLPVTFPRAGRKNFVGAFRGISFDFTPPDADTSLLDLVELALPNVDVATLTPPEGLPGLGNVFIDRLFLDVPQKTFCTEARLAGQTFDIIPNVLALQDIYFHLCLEKTKQKTVRHQMVVGGTVTIGAITTKAMLDQQGNVVVLTANIVERITVVDILNAFGASFIPDGHGLTSVLQSNGFDSFGLTNTIIVANRTKGSGGKHTSTVSISSTADLPGLTADVQILFTGLGTTTKQTVAVFSLPRIALATIVDKVSGLNIAGLPFLGELALPASSITIASKQFVSLPSGFKFANPLVTGARLAKGVSLNYLQSIGGQLKNFQLGFRPGSFDITLVDFPTLEDALSMLIPDIRQSDIFRALPNVVPGVFGLTVNRLAYDNSAGKLTIEAELNSFTLIPNLLEITTSSVKAEIAKKPLPGRAQSGNTNANAGSVTLSIQGDVKLFGLSLTLNVNYDQRKKAFGIKITSPSGEIKFEKLFELIGSATNDLTNPAVAALQLGKSSIINPLFEVNKRSGSLAFRIRGTPTITGFGLFTAEALANTQPRQFILTLNAQEFSMVTMIESLTGLDLSGIFFLGLLRGPSNIGVTLSATNVPRIPFPISSYPLNETTSIDRGLGFTVAFRLPADCAGDPICNFFQLILGSQAIIFRVTGINGPQATIAYRLPAMLSLGPVKLYNVDFGFSVSATKPPTVGLTNIEMDVPVPFPADGQQPLHFRGRLLIDPTSNVEASLQMIGIYERAFGIPILSFGNVDLGFRTNIGCPICVSQLRFGGELALGQNCYRGNKANCVIAQAIFNVDAVDVKNNYFYFAVNQLSFRKVLTSVGIPDNPALVILDAVNMRDVEASYSTIDRNIPSGILPGGKTIKAGLVFKGIFNVLFLVNVKVDVAVELLFGVPKSVNALVEVDPIILGPLRITAASDSRKGPKFELTATVLPPSFFFSIDGKISISALQFSASVLAKIDNNGLSVRATGPVFGFPSTFLLQAQFVNIRNPKTFTHFRVAGSFSTLGAGLVDGVKRELESASRALKANLDAAVARLRAADRAVADAVGQLNIKGAAEREARRKLDDAKAALQRAEDTVRGLCSIRDCNGCQNVPKPCIVQRCACTIPYPCCRRWSCSTCCRTVCIPTPSFCGTHCVPWVDPVCVTANVACEALRATAFAVRIAAQATLTAAQKTVEGAAAATALATTAVGNARVLSRAARGVSDGLQASFNGLTSAISGLLNVFRINNVGFDVLVDSVNGGRISVSIDLVVGGSHQALRATINLNNIAEYAAQLARRFYSQYF